MLLTAKGFEPMPSYMHRSKKKAYRVYRMKPCSLSDVVEFITSVKTGKTRRDLLRMRDKKREISSEETQR